MDVVNVVVCKLEFQWVRRIAAGTYRAAKTPSDAATNTHEAHGNIGLSWSRIDVLRALSASSVKLLQLGRRVRSP
jgi:hypothetical protein